MSVEEKETTGRELCNFIESIKTIRKPLPGYEGETISRYQVGVCMDEVFPGIYIGDLRAAKNLDYLKKVGITHIVNTAQGDTIANVDTNADYYRNQNIEYYGLVLHDCPSFDIAKYFEESAEYIDNALRNGGKILVHCYMGISRSTTITTCFLMLKKGMNAKDALNQIKRNRAVHPNDGFLKQLADLDNTLAKKRKDI